MDPIYNLTTTVFINGFAVVYQIVITTHFESQKILFSLCISFLFSSLTISCLNSDLTNSNCQATTLLIGDTHSKVRDADIVQISIHTECSNLTEARWVQYVCNHENNVPSRLSPQWLCGNSCTWAHDVHHVPKCMSCHKSIVVITGEAHCFHDYM